MLNEKYYLAGMRMRVGLTLLFLLSLQFSFSFPQQRKLLSHSEKDSIYTIESVPNPKASPGWNYVSNPDNVISSSTVDAINNLLKEVEDSTTSQVAVVILNSIGSAVPHDFGVDLANQWAAGRADKDNGLLILLVIDQHAIEFLTGKGMEAVLTDTKCKYISETFMVPYAKAGNFDAAVLGGVKAVTMELENPANSEDLFSQELSSFPSTPWYQQPVSMIALAAAALIYFGLNIQGRKNRRKRKPKNEYERSQENKSYMEAKFWLLNLAVPVAWLLYQWRFNPPVTVLELAAAGYLYGILLLVEKRMRLNGYIEKQYEGDRHQLYAGYTKSHSSWVAAYIFFPFPFLLYKLWKDAALRRFRFKPYPCEKCGSTMVRLDEKSDDAYLTSPQLKEEELHSVDYDVWHCNNCGNQKILNYTNYFSKYKECPACHIHAYFLSKTKTVTPPTHSHSGKGVKIYDCLNCKHQDQKEFVIPMLTSSSSSSGSGFSSGGSSGGSSWGGGSFGGGGSSSRW